VQVAVHEPIAGQGSDPDPRRGWDPVEALVEIRQQVTRSSEWERGLADGLHHRRTLEPVHDEIAITGVVDVRTRIAVGPDVAHDLSLGDQ
jgi:hypothetical protein